MEITIRSTDHHQLQDINTNNGVSEWRAFDSKFIADRVGK
jgi:hypothetical protein